MKTYRGSPSAARNYVETGRARADDYYLAEGTGIAERYEASVEFGVRRCVPLTGDAYEAWVAGFDPRTGLPKGRLRNDEHAVRFVEVGVNGPKSWSLAAELHPDISTAYDAAQDRAAEQILAWLARHATARIGPRGAQIQLPVTQIEAVTVRHHTSRAGDPHRHLHLQINARVRAEGRWRGLHTVGIRDSLDAINGFGHAAMMTDPGFRAALAAHGFTLTPDSGEVVELRAFVGPFSARAAQIGSHLQRYEADWRAAHPGREPGPVLRRTWDARAWADARPDKILPRDGTELTRRWVDQLHELGYRDAQVAAGIGAASVGALDRGGAVAEVLSRLAARRAGWNAADIRGEVEQLIARRNIVTDAAIRCELAEDLTARALAECVPLLHRTGVPEHVRALTSRRVLEVEDDIITRLADRAAMPAEKAALTRIDEDADALRVLDPAQRQAVTALTGDRQLVVVEGAAGAGKTSTLAATRTGIEDGGHRLVVVTPTRKAADVAGRQLGTRAFSAAWLAHQHGYRWSADGAWTRLAPVETDPATGTVYAGPSEPAQLRAGDLLLVDEAGMLDQDTALALLTLADDHHARIAFVGDRHQLPAVGRGGVLDHAVRWADPAAYLTLDAVHRFSRTAVTATGAAVRVADEQYANLTLAMRAGTDAGKVFDQLLARDQIQLYPDAAARDSALADTAAHAVLTGASTLLVADTREQVAALNTAVRERLVSAGQVDDRRVTVTDAGERIGLGDRVVTRRNDTELAVANRDTWTVTGLTNNADVVVTGTRGGRTLPAAYARGQVELGYASTVHGVQGETAAAADLLLDEHTTAASAYVAMTRGREHNTAHLVAASIDDAREQWVTTFARDRADLGPAHAAELAATQAARYAPLRPLDQVLDELHAAWTVEEDLRAELAALEQTRDALVDIRALTRERDTAVPRSRQDYEDAKAAAATAAKHAERVEAMVAAHADQVAEQLQRDWNSQRGPARHAAHVVLAGPGRLGQRTRAVNRATDELANWSVRWQPYLPDMPTRTARIVDFAARFDDPPATHDALQRYAHAAAEQAHRELEPTRNAAADTNQRHEQAWTTWQQTISRYDRQLSSHGNLARHPRPDSYLTELADTIPTVRAETDAAHQRVTGLLAEPTLRVLPPDRIDAERERWRADRDAAHELASRAFANSVRAAPREPIHYGIGSIGEPYGRGWEPTQQRGHGISR